MRFFWGGKKNRLELRSNASMPEMMEEELLMQKKPGATREMHETAN